MTTNYFQVLHDNTDQRKAVLECVISLIQGHSNHRVIEADDGMDGASMSVTYGRHPKRDRYLVLTEGEVILRKSTSCSSMDAAVPFGHLVVSSSLDEYHNGYEIFEY